jgi:hypothetical protein
MIEDKRLRLQHFDYGTDCGNLTRYRETCNQQKYGTLEPPEYDLTKIRVPVFIMQSKHARVAEGHSVCGSELQAVEGTTQPVHVPHAQPG